VRKARIIEVVDEEEVE
jgi:hypothetical protein